jgi:hypothetical protein
MAAAFLQKFTKTKIWTIVGIVATLGSAVAGAKLIGDSGYRPVLKGEVEHVLPVENYRNLQLATQQRIDGLNERQLRVREQQLNTDRREYKRSLSNDKERRAAYRRREEPVPEYLIEDISDGELLIQDIDDAKGIIQNQLLDYAK